MLQFLSKEFDMDAIQFGYFQTLGAAVMFIGSPIFGRFADNFGARYAVIAANISLLSYYLTLVFATNIYMFFFSQVTLCFAHYLPGMNCIQH